MLANLEGSLEAFANFTGNPTVLTRRSMFKTAAGLYLASKAAGTAQAASQGSYTVEYSAKVAAEAASYYPGGRGLEGLITKFAHAHMYANPDDDGNVVGAAAGRFIDTLRRTSREDQGICNGNAFFQVLLEDPVPGGGSLGRDTFARNEIFGLGGILEFGDSPAIEKAANGRIFQESERNTPALLDHLVTERLGQAQGFGIDISPNDETWMYPVDYAHVTRTRVTGGWLVTLTLGAANYSDEPHISRFGPRRSFHFTYQIADDLSNLGTFISQDVPLKFAGYPDPTRFLATHRIRGNVMTRRMINSLYHLSGGIIRDDCYLSERDCD